MFHGVKKLMSFFLVLTVLLAPLESVAAHEMGQVMVASKMAMPQLGDQHTSHDMANSADQECDGQNVCNDCVYCAAPALGFRTEVTLDKPDAEPPQSIFISRYSIDQPVEFRPPRQL